MTAVFTTTVSEIRMEEDGVKEKKESKGVMEEVGSGSKGARGTENITLIGTFVEA